MHGRRYWVLTGAREAVALVAREAGAREGTQCVGARGEHVTRPVLALVLVCGREAYHQHHKNIRTKESAIAQLTYTRQLLYPHTAMLCTTHHHLSTLSMNLSNLFLKESMVSALTT